MSKYKYILANFHPFLSFDSRFINVNIIFCKLFWHRFSRRNLYAFFDKTKTGELINRLSADTQLVSQAVTQQVSDGLRSSLMTSAGIGMMFFMSPQLAMVGIFVYFSFVNFS